MIQMSQTVGALFAALAKAQGVMPSAAKDATGQVGQARTKYADLPSVREAARLPLAENDLAVLQFPTSAPAGAVRIITILIHASGEWISDDEGMTVPAGNNTAQAIGSAVTYGKRYSYQAALGIVADDDDDGHAATKAASARQTPARQRTAPDAPAPAPSAGSITEPQIKKMAATMRELGIVERSHRLEVIAGIVGRPIGSSNDLSKQEAGMVIDALETRLAQQVPA